MVVRGHFPNHVYQPETETNTPEEKRANVHEEKIVLWVSGSSAPQKNAESLDFFSKESLHPLALSAKNHLSWVFWHLPPKKYWKIHEWNEVKSRLYTRAALTWWTCSCFYSWPIHQGPLSLTETKYRTAASCLLIAQGSVSHFNNLVRPPCLSVCAVSHAPCAALFEETKQKKDILTHRGWHIGSLGKMDDIYKNEEIRTLVI